MSSPEEGEIEVDDFDDPEEGEVQEAGSGEPAAKRQKRDGGAGGVGQVSAQASHRRSGGVDDKAAAQVRDT
jgi:hypothetical protein